MEEWKGLGTELRESGVIVATALLAGIAGGMTVSQKTLEGKIWFVLPAVTVVLSARVVLRWWYAEDYAEE